MILTPRAQQLIVLATSYASQLNHTYLAAEHILAAAIDFKGETCLELKKQLKIKTIKGRALRHLKIIYK